MREQDSYALRGMMHEMRMLMGAEENCGGDTQCYLQYYGDPQKVSTYLAELMKRRQATTESLQRILAHIEATAFDVGEVPVRGEAVSTAASRG